MLKDGSVPADGVVPPHIAGADGFYAQARGTAYAPDAAISPLYFSCTPYAVSAKLTGMTRTGFQEYDFCDGAKIAS